jgi:type I restriction enzyme S subunit
MNWQQVKIGDLGRVVTGKTPPTKQRQYYDGEYPFVTPSDLDYDTYRITKTETTLSDEAKAKYPNQFLPANAVSFTCIASVGKIGVTTEESLTNQQINSVIVQDTHDWRFVYYLLRNNAKRILGMCSGVATPIINKGDFEKVQVNIPDVRANEEAIADVLSAYDDMIENNGRRIQLLEESARLLYKEWFVHLRFPGHEHTQIIDGVPEGWEVGTIGDLGEVITGKTPSKKKPENFGSDLPFIKTPDMHGNAIVVHTEESLSEEGAKTQANKTLPPRSILVSCIGTVGAVSFNASPAQTNQQINSIVPASDLVTYWAYFMAKELKPLLEGMGGGATMANVNKSKFSGIKVVIPSKQLLNLFSDFAKPVFDQIENLTISNARLAKARDLLLPKLMNDEVAV